MSRSQIDVKVEADAARANAEFARLQSHMDPGLTRAAESASKSVSSFLTGAAREALGFSSAMIAVNTSMAVGQRAFDSLGKAVFGMNSTLETSTLQFKVFMGNADDAREHVKELFKFAKDTPFETKPIIEASRLLETFGGAALNTMGNLTLFGNAAAATQAPIEEVSFWVGRMYAALQSGRPFGEALQRFQELGLVSPTVIAQLEQISEKGGDQAKAWELLTTDLGRFDGAMKEQAGTWTGLTSTYGDTIRILTSEAFAPFFDTAKKGLSDLNDLLGSDAAEQFSRDMAQRFSEVLTNTGDLKDEYVRLFGDMIDQGHQPLDAALEVTAALIGEKIGADAKRDFENTTGAIASAAGAVRSLAGEIGALAGPLAQAIGLANQLAAALGGMPGIPNVGGAISGARSVGDFLGRAGEFLDAAGRANVAASLPAPYIASEHEVPPWDNPLAAAAVAADAADAAAADAAAGPGRAGRAAVAPTFSTAPGRGGGGRGGGGGGGGGGVAPKLPAIAGFMQSDNASDYQAMFGADFGKIASALDVALRENTESSGQAVRKAMESAATALREAGDVDWKPAIEDLASHLHDSLVERTPETVAATHELLREMGAAFDELQLNKKLEAETKKLNDRLTEMTASTVKQIDTLFANQQLSDHIRDITREFDQVQQAAAGAFRSGQQDEAINRQRAREDFHVDQARATTVADMDKAHQKALQETHKLTGQAQRDAVTAENKRYAEAKAAFAEQVQREDAARKQRQEEEDADRLFQQAQADQLDAFLKTQMSERDMWTRINIEQPALLRRLKEIKDEFETRKAKELATYDETTAELAKKFAERLDTMDAVQAAHDAAQAAGQAASSAVGSSGSTGGTGPAPLPPAPGGGGYIQPGNPYNAGAGGGASAGPTVVVNLNGPVYGIDDLNQQITDALRSGDIRVPGR